MKIRIVIVLFCIFLGAYAANANTYYNSNQTFNNAISTSNVVSSGSNGTANNGGDGQTGENGVTGWVNGGAGGSGGVVAITVSNGNNAYEFGKGGNGGAGGDGHSGDTRHLGSNPFGGVHWAGGGGGGGGSGGSGGAGSLGGFYFFKGNNTNIITINFNNSVTFSNITAVGGQGADGGAGGGGKSEGGQGGFAGTAGTNGGSTGGAISSYYSNVNFSSNATFTGNKAQYGGTISYVGGTYKFTGANTNISNNTADVSGGAIAVYKGVLTLQNNIVFQNNKANGTAPYKSGWGYGGNGGNGGRGGDGGRGGGDGAKGSNGTAGGVGLPDTDTSTLSIYGVGGAIFATETNINFQGNASLISNIAVSSGGAIYLQKSTITFSSNSSIIRNNTASKSGGAIFADNTNVNFQGNVSLTSNTATNSGGGIYLNKSKFYGNSASTITFSGNLSSNNGGAIFADDTNINFGSVSLASNTATNYGGGIYLNKLSMTVSGKSSFTNNKASSNDGGAIYAISKTTITFSGDSSFTNNTTSRSGGAIYANDTNIKFLGNVSLISNTATNSHSGGIYLNKSTITVSGNSSFINNKSSTNGGAISADEGNITFQGNVSLVSNTATNSNGGGIYLNKSNLVAVSTDIKFIGNKAANGSGGAMYMYAISKTTITVLGAASFISNIALSSGGAIYADDVNMTFQGNVSLVSNTATNYNGGGIYLNKSKLSVSKDIEFIGNKASNGLGGAIYALETNINFQGNVSLANNTATYSSSIYLQKSNLSVSKDISFIGNSAFNGGAIYAISETTITISSSGNSSIINNIASNAGGAIYADDTNITFQGSVSLANNKAVYSNGGGIYLDKSKLTVSKDIKFIGNEAANGLGGAIYALETNITFQGNVSVASNMAVNSNGGGIYLQKSNLSVSKDIEFIGNKASNNSGGAIYAINRAIITVSGNSSFINNTALINGGAIYALETNMTFQGNVSLVSNTVTNTTNFIDSYGGGLYLQKSTITVSGNLSFISNTASDSGGGAYLKDSYLLIDDNTKTIEFNGNYGIDGGALYASNSKIKIEGANTTTIFQNNEAYLGSAIMFDGKVEALFANGNFKFQNNESVSTGTINVFNSQSDYNSPLIFENIASLTVSSNIASSGGFIGIRRNNLKISGDNIDVNANIAFVGHGGAIYAENSDILLEGTLNFENNFAYQQGGAIYASSSSNINIKSFGGGITFRDNLMNVVESNDISLKDSKLLLYGANHITFNSGIVGDSLSEIIKYDDNTVYLGGKTDFEGVLNILRGSLSITTSNVNIAELNISENAILTGTTIHTAQVKELNVEGEIHFNVDFINDTADKIIVSSAAVFSDSSEWHILPTGKLMGSKVYTILEGNFGDSRFSNEKLNIANREYSLEYYQNRIDLIMNYVETPALESDTKNQKALSDLFNVIYFDEDNLRGMPSDIVQLTSDIFELRNANAALFQRAIENLSGKFYADIIMSAADMYNNSIIFNRLNAGLLSVKYNKNIWAQGIMRSKTLPSDEEQLGDFENNDAGAMFGADIVLSGNMVIGLFGQYIANEYLQDDNSADGQELGFGLYAFNDISDALDIGIKSSLSYNLRHVNAKRSFSIANNIYKPEAEFDLSAIKLAAQIGKDFKVKNKLSISPFVGVQGAIAFNDKIEEKGGDRVNLIIEEGSNSRLDGTFGVNINYDINKVLALRSGVNGCVAIIGEKGTIKEALSAQREYSMEIESTKENLYFGIDLELDYKIGDNFIAYINGAYGTNSQYLVGLGVSYRVVSVKK